MSKGTRQHGFAVIEAVLIFVIVALVGGIGYYVYHTNNKAVDTYDAANSASSSTPYKKKQIKAESTATDTTYLTVKEWDVRIPLTVESKNAEYKYIDGNVLLGVSGLPNGDCAADGTSIGLVTRFVATDIDPETKKTYASTYPNAVKVGKYSFAYVSPQAHCSDDADVRADADKVRASLVSQLKHIETTPTE